MSKVRRLFAEVTWQQRCEQISVALLIAAMAICGVAYILKALATFIPPRGGGRRALRTLDAEAEGEAEAVAR